MVEESGLHLVVDVAESDLRILRSAPIPSVPRRALQPPFLDVTKKYDFNAPVSELVLDLLDAKGKVLESFGWAWRAEAFSDQPLRGESDGFQGGRVRSDHTLRLLEIPAPPSASFLLFARSDVGPGPGPRGVRRTELVLYSLVTPPLPAPPLPVATRTLPGPIDLPGDL